MPEITELYALNDVYVNLAYPMPNGCEMKLLDDNEIYLGTQVECEFNDDGQIRCFGLVAGMAFLLDSLMGAEIAKVGVADSSKVTGSIIITSPNENVIATCYKVMSSQKMKGGKRTPQYSLFGVTGSGNYFWGEPTTFLGWYANAEQLSKEIAEIQNAITQGIPTYELKYSAKVERKWLRIVMVDEPSEEK